MVLRYTFLAAFVRARFGDDERGASLVEYALLVALIAIICIGAIQLVGDSAESKLTEVGEEINNAPTSTSSSVPE